MKKLISVALALVLALSLVACTGGNSNTPNSGAIPTPAEGYDAEFTVIIGYGDEWTPFPGKSGVVFANSESGVISVTDDGTTVKFIGLAVGESVITATLDGQESKALVKVRAAAGKDETAKENAPYIAYNPPTEYYIELKENTGEIWGYCKIGKGYTEVVPGVDPYSIYFNGATFEVYGKTDGGWDFVEESSEWHKDEVTQALETASKPLNEFFEILFNATGSRDSESAAQFYVGAEKLLGRDCAIYEISDSGVMGHGTSRTWVDIATGCWLKYESSEIGRDKEVREVTVFKLDNLEWNNTLRP